MHGNVIEKNDVNDSTFSLLPQRIYRIQKSIFLLIINAAFKTIVIYPLNVLYSKIRGRTFIKQQTKRGKIKLNYENMRTAKISSMEYL